MTKDWKDIHEDFGTTPWQSDKTYQQAWEESSITYEQAKGWINANFTPFDLKEVKLWKDYSFTPQQTKEWAVVLGKSFKGSYGFCAWLRDTKELTSQKINADDRDKLREEYNALWKDIHEGFKDEWKWKSWENQGFAPQETKQWINASFAYDKSETAKQWKNYGFTSEEARKWIEVRNKSNLYYLNTDYCEHFFYLKKNFEQINYQFSQLSEEKLSNIIYPNAQAWLDFWYPLEGNCIYQQDKNNFGKTREKIIYLNINYALRDGSLKLEKFTNLKHLNCYEIKLTNLNLNNCINLQTLNCKGNHLTSLDLSNNLEIINLDCSNNQLTNLYFLDNLNENNLTNLDIGNNNFSESDLTPFSRFINLQKLFIGSDDEKKIEKIIYNRFIGSLEPLQKMNKLEILDIDNTDLKKDIEYLPDNIKQLFCSANQREDARCQFIANRFANKEGMIETDENGIKNFSQKIQRIKAEAKKEVIFRIDTITSEVKRSINSIDSTDLSRELRLNYNLENNRANWKDYLKTAVSSDDLDIKKENISTIIKKLKKGLKKGQTRKTFKNEFKNQKHYQTLLEQKIQDLENQLIFTTKQKISEQKQTKKITEQLNKIQAKKFQRKQLLSNLNFQNNPSLTFWLNELISNQKQVVNNSLQSAVLENIQNKLLKLGISQEKINNLCELQKEISRLNRLLLKLEAENKQHVQYLTKETGLTTRLKRALSISSETSQEKTKLPKTDNQEYQSKPMEIDYSTNNYQNLHPNFTSESVNSWQNLNFTYSQTQEWINIGLNPEDYNFANFLKNQKNLTPEKVLNEHREETLRQEFREFEQTNQQAQIIQTNLPNFQNK